VSDKDDREKSERPIADNRKALHDYHVLDTWEAGVVLLGTEVKAIREGRVQSARQLRAPRERRSVAVERPHQPVQPHRLRTHAERRQRKLLLHRDEIRKLTGRVVEKG
jgi:SsrA-binding protein